MAAMSRFKFPHIEQPTLRIRAMRYFMTIFCFLFLILGTSVVICGALLAARRLSECEFIGQFYSGVYLLLAAGCITCFFSLLTCLRTQLCSSAADFMPLSVVVIVVLTLQVLAVIAGHIFYVLAVDGQLRNGMKSSWQNYDGTGRGCVDAVQRYFQCCGVSSPLEWFLKVRNVSSASAYPPSCHCSQGASNCSPANDTNANISFTSYVYSKGCYNIYLGDLEDTLLVTRIVGPIMALLEFIFILVVIYFLHHIENRSLVGAYVVRSPMPGEGSACAVAGRSAWSELEERPPATRLSPVPGSGPGSQSVSRDDTVMHL